MNEAIQGARDVGLDILKPSRRDIEHGMELHQNSIVCDSYGFAPRAAVDGEAVAAAVQAGASEGRDPGHDRRYVDDPICYR